MVFQHKVGHGAVPVFSEETQKQNSRKITSKSQSRKQGLYRTEW